MIEETASEDYVKNNSSSSLIEYCGDSESKFSYRISSGDLE